MAAPTDQLTTAAALLAFRKELVGGGLSPEEVTEMLFIAAKALISEGGLAVSMDSLNG